MSVYTGRNGGWGGEKLRFRLFELYGLTLRLQVRLVYGNLV